MSYADKYLARPLSCIPTIGCGEGSTEGDPPRSKLAIGDRLLAWNYPGASVPEVAGNLLGDIIETGCECSVNCGPVVDGATSADGSEGALPDLVRQAIDDGAQVAWVGYMYPLPDGIAFTECRAELNAFRARLADLDAAEADMIFVDNPSIGDGVSRAMYEIDGIHPSVAGSSTIAQNITEQVRSRLDG